MKLSLVLLVAAVAVALPTGSGDGSYQYGPFDGSSSGDASGRPDSYGTSPTQSSSPSASPSVYPYGSSPSASPYVSSPPAYPSGTSSSSSPSSSSSSSSSGNNGTLSSVGGPIVDDYPTKYKDSCGSVDQWSLTACQCTSFVAWRIDQRLNSDFSRSFDDETWSNANTWANAAQGAGLTVNNTPEVGAIAQTTAGDDGHVAWVCGVSGDQIQIEEYNALNSQAYDTRTVSASGFQFIHIPVSSPGS